MRSAITVAAATLCLLSALTGCHTAPRTADTQPSLAITPSRTKVLVGETVTITPTTRNLVGLDSSIDWTTTGGRIEPINDGRAAQVTFDRPGTFQVGADLMIDGQIRSRALTSIRVREVP